MQDTIRYVLVGTGNRGTTMWGRDLLRGWGDRLDLAAICETNRVARRTRAPHDRLQRADP